LVCRWTGKSDAQAARYVNYDEADSQQPQSFIGRVGLRAGSQKEFMNVCNQVSGIAQVTHHTEVVDRKLPQYCAGAKRA